MFQVDVPDGNKSQLEMTLWDPSQAYGTGKVRVSLARVHARALARSHKCAADFEMVRPLRQAFLGEVILNVSKLVPFEGQQIEQGTATALLLLVFCRPCALSFSSGA